MLRFSYTRNEMIRGDENCPFWRVEDNGVCYGWPGEKRNPCPANEDGIGCPFKEEGGDDK